MRYIYQVHNHFRTYHFAIGNVSDISLKNRLPINEIKPFQSLMFLEALQFNYIL